jgi:hypothetical protein
MRITGIDSKESDLERGEIALKTEPALTVDVFQFALRNFWAVQGSDNFAFKSDGLLRVMRTTLPAIRVQEYESALTNAETALANQKTAIEGARKDFLKGLSDDSGLPLQ